MSWIPAGRTGSSTLVGRKLREQVSKGVRGRGGHRKPRAWAFGETGNVRTHTVLFRLRRKRLCSGPAAPSSGRESRERRAWDRRRLFKTAFLLR